ncbi:MCM DNA helicase complex subunit [Ciborinia camelliae]|nr:MCM DNA helicase complex subunit [Ciborinia camelliae]
MTRHTFIQKKIRRIPARPSVETTVFSETKSKRLGEVHIERSDSTQDEDEDENTRFDPKNRKRYADSLDDHQDMGSEDGNSAGQTSGRSRIQSSEPPVPSSERSEADAATPRGQDSNEVDLCPRGLHLFTCLEMPNLSLPAHNKPSMKHRPSTHNSVLEGLLEAIGNVEDGGWRMEGSWHGEIFGTGRLVITDITGRRLAQLTHSASMTGDLVRTQHGPDANDALPADCELFCEDESPAKARWVSGYPGDFASPSTSRKLDGFINLLASDPVFAAAASVDQKNRLDTSF